MTRLPVAAVAVALPFLAAPAPAQDLRQLLLLESREFLQQHLKKLESWDPAALDDYAPDAIRIFSIRRAGSDASRESRGTELRRQMTRELADARQRHEQYTWADFNVSLVGSSVQYCARPTLKPPPPPPPPPAGQPAPPPPRGPARVHPERVCWTIGTLGTAGYKIFEVTVQQPP